MHYFYDQIVGFVLSYVRTVQPNFKKEILTGRAMYINEIDLACTNDHKRSQECTFPSFITHFIDYCDHYIDFV